MTARPEIRLEWNSPDQSPVPAIPLDVLPFPSALLDRAGSLVGANAGWMAAHPAARPGAPLHELVAGIHATEDLRAGLCSAIQDTLAGAAARVEQETEGRRIVVSACGTGALLMSQPAASGDTAARTQSEKMETVGRLVGGVVHDFANLVTMIAGYSDILLNRLGAKDPLRPELEEIAKAASRGARLTGQLLGFTRGQLAQPRLVDLNGIVRDTERMLRPIIGEYVELEIALLADPGKVMADPGQMEQVIMNLILNARDAMPRGGRVRIETSDRDLGDAEADRHGIVRGPVVLLSISDTGHGIDPAALEHVFEPFFTTKEHGRGTGLGLHTVHRIIKQSGGDIWVRSDPGQGATFFICLPRPAQLSDTGEAAAPERQPARGCETILLVEDEEGVRRLLTHVLRKRGYQVLEACDGADALRIFGENVDEIHLVLTDMVMPGMSGRELGACLRKIRPELPIVFMSGYTDDVLVRTGALSPGMSFLQKPLRPEVLAARLREALDSPVRPFNPR